MNRRRFLTLLSVAGVAAVGGGYALIKENQPARPLTVEAAIATIDTLLAAQLMSTGEWQLTKMFRHCAQSIQLSMQGGYPEHKSDNFKRLVGQNALMVFESIGAMSHSLNEDIPGALAISEEGSVEQALQELKASYQAFKAHKGDLLPHFAYGELTKQQYEVAHVLHLYNHLDEVTLKA